MAVTKRLRYEILRRDNHACRYCGARAPEAELVVDHVVPQALGGLDEPGNLVAACAPCNSGKGSSSPDAPVVAEVHLDAMRWLHARQIAVTVLLEEEAIVREHCRWFFNAWCEVMPDPGGTQLPVGWDKSVVNFMRLGLSDRALLEDLMFVTASAGHVQYKRRFNYFCGCCWKKVERIQQETEAIIRGGK